MHSSRRAKPQSAETEMYTYEYEKATRAATSPQRRRPASSRPSVLNTVASDISEVGNAVGMEDLRESLSSRASRRLAEAMQFSATQSPVSPLTPRDGEERFEGQDDGMDTEHADDDDGDAFKWGGECPSKGQRHEE